MRVRMMVLGLLVMLPLGIARADNPDRLDAEGWIGRRLHLDEGRLVACVVSADRGRPQSLHVSIWADWTWQMDILARDRTWPEGTILDTSLRIDGVTRARLGMEAKSPDRLTARLPDSKDLFKALQAGQTLELRLPDERRVMPLDGAARALDFLFECARANAPLPPDRSQADGQDAAQDSLSAVAR